MTRIVLSPLPHTWLVDVDGTIVVHNGHKRGGDALLPGVREFWAEIPDEDVIVLLSARTEVETAATLAFLAGEGLRWDRVLFGLPAGERILINDAKPSGLTTALAVDLPRDAGLSGVAVTVDPER